MPEMKLIIKPEFETQAVQKFAQEVNRQVGAAAGSGGSGGASKEDKKQTSLLEGIFKYAKIGALLNAPDIALGASRQVQALGLGAAGATQAALGAGDQREQLARMLESGDSVNQQAADRIRAGEDLNSVLDETVILSEYLEQYQKNQVTHSEDSRKNMRLLQQLWLQVNQENGVTSDNLKNIQTTTLEWAEDWGLINKQVDDHNEKLKETLRLTKEIKENQVSSVDRSSFYNLTQNDSPLQPISSTILKTNKFFTGR